MAELLLNEIDELAGAGAMVWELFHENSKTSLFEPLLSTAVLIEKMTTQYGALPFHGFSKIALPASRPLPQRIDEIMQNRASARLIGPRSVSLEELATLLHYAYGITRHNRDTEFPCPFRMVPSGGALYPLDIFLHCSNVDGLEPGIYHYNPLANNLTYVKAGDQSRMIADGLVQSKLADDIPVFFFIAAMFERSTFKYGERGYRFVLLEAGHVAQNLSLTACALGMGCLNIGGFFDRKIDELLNLDGLHQSTIYMAGVGDHGAPDLSP